jgi:hypothetical protein
METNALAIYTILFLTGLFVRASNTRRRRLKKNHLRYERIKDLMSIL